MKSPGVRFPPLLIYVIGYAIGWLIDYAWSWPILSGGRHVIITILGWMLIGFAIVIVVSALAIFRSRKTGIYPTQPASEIVSSGPYRFTRNPMYLGMTSFYVGLALLMNMLWPLLMLPIGAAILVKYVITREERYLREAFGEAYEEYCRRVRRWI